MLREHGRGWGFNSKAKIKVPNPPLEINPEVG
jgi:hypothetical protein